MVSRANNTYELIGVGPTTGGGFSFDIGDDFCFHAGNIEKRKLINQFQGKKKLQLHDRSH